jgi:hypothetical protein
MPRFWPLAAAAHAPAEGGLAKAADRLKRVG